MNSDEREIRDLIATWARATQAGDIDTVLGLMTEDVVFLLPNQQALIGREAFAAAARAMTAASAPRFESTSEIQEIEIVGEHAFMWTRLRVEVHPPGGAPPATRAGFTLSVLRKDGGRWRIARDANLLAPVA